MNINKSSNTNNKKLAFIDLDGTLLAKRHHINAESIEAISLLKTKNYEPIICTGRDRLGVEWLFDKLKDVQYYICNNGSFIYDKKNKEILFSDYLTWNNIKNLVTFFENNNLQFCLYTDKGVFTNKINLFMKKVAHIYNYELQYFEEFSKLIKEKHLIKIFKLFVPKSVIKHKKLHAKIIESKKNFTITDLFYGWDINKKNINKGNAAIFLAKKVNISFKNSIGFGDGDNDVTLAKKTSKFIAMNKSNKNLLVYATYIAHKNRKIQILDSVKKYC